MVRGRKPLPDNVKVLKGTAQKCRINPKKPKPIMELPDCPEWLNPTAQDTWNRLAPVLHKMGILTLTDCMAFEVLCIQYSLWKETSQILNEKGLTYDTTNPQGATMHRPRPEVGIRSDAYRMLVSMMSEFGLTPSSRDKIVVDIQPEANDPMEDLLNGL